MTAIPPDRSRARRIEDLSNLWIVHPIARLLVAPAIRTGVSANAVSVVGLAIGAAAALAYARALDERGWAWVGLALAVGWLVADGLDGMVARATNSASALGRVLDGLCDHGVFILIYVALALHVGTGTGWLLACAAGLAHAIQSSLYEGERARYHRRIRGEPPKTDERVPLYDAIAGAAGAGARALDVAMASAPDAIRADYADRAAPPMRLEALLSANIRVFAITIACLFARPELFWWFEIGPLTVVCAAGLFWHRRVEAGYVAAASLANDRRHATEWTFDTTRH